MATEPLSTTPAAAAPAGTQPVVSGSGLVKRFGSGDAGGDALRGVDIAFQPVVGIVGAVIPARRASRLNVLATISRGE